MKLCYHCMQQIHDEKLHTCPHCGKSLKIEQTSSKFLAPGTILQGKFIVGCPLGAGGFGNTYIGWNQLLLRKVAIKEFYPEQYSGRADDGITVTVTNDNLQPRFRKGLQQFLEEARSVAALQDIKGVVEISNFFEENGTGYIVMEYLEGMDVKTILKKSENKKDYEWSRRVVLTVLHTLRDIHKRGVLHRDIAPDNIFVTSEGVIKLIDFGAAKHASALANMKSDVVLKIGYAPIEQYSRNAQQGSYTDLYAVAALFYRMLTGQKPIPANERVHQDALIPPSEMGVELPEQAEMAIMVCLNVKPEYRLQSAEEFMEALDGKYFIPVYEPEWILPPAEERNHLSRKLSGLPVAAKVGICLVGIGLVAGLAAGGVAFSRKCSQNIAGINSNVADGMIRMEDYTGKQYDEAVAELKRQGFQNIAEPQFDFGSAAEGTVTRQSIDPFEVVDAESELVFTVSGGEEYYSMPDFSGASEKEVIQFFTERNFDVEVHEDPYDCEVYTVKRENDNLKKKTGKILVSRYFSKDVSEGMCYDQSVASGEKWKASQNVSLFVSMGGEEADFFRKMPEFTNMTKAEVKKKLKSQGLENIVTIQFKESADYSDTVAVGTVMRQSITPGKKINTIKDKGKKLTLYLSAGPEPTPTPNSTPSSSSEPVTDENNRGVSRSFGSGRCLTLS